MRWALLRLQDLVRCEALAQRARRVALKTVAIILCLASLGSLTLIHATLLRWRVELPLLPFSALRARRLDGTWFKSWDRGWADEGAGALPGYLARQGRDPIPGYLVASQVWATPDDCRTPQYTGYQP